MKMPSILVATAIALIIGIFMESDVIARIGFIATGLCAGAIAQNMPRGAERPYWGFVLVIIALVVASYFGVSLSRLWFILPIVFVISYFFARLVLKLQPKEEKTERFR